jgi:hypothetical protein
MNIERDVKRPASAFSSLANAGSIRV